MVSARGEEGGTPTLLSSAHPHHRSATSASTYALMVCAQSEIQPPDYGARERALPALPSARGTPPAASSLRARNAALQRADPLDPSSNAAGRQWIRTSPTPIRRRCPAYRTAQRHSGACGQPDAFGHRYCGSTRRYRPAEAPPTHIRPTAAGGRRRRCPLPSPPGRRTPIRLP
jgi:hypothetical protein